MHVTVVFQTLGVLMMMFSATLLAPLGVSLYVNDGDALGFNITLIASAATGLLLWLPLQKRQPQLLNRHGFTVVALLWTVMSLLGSLPFIFVGGMDVASALFESASAFTTTGATIIADLESISPSLLFYRQELQWIGGIGVIVAAVALLPMLRIGGMQLYKAETPGPIKDEKLTPRIAQTARTLCTMYFGLTAACALLYWLAGMSAFDAIAHSFSTLSTGGFSTHNESFAFFDSPAIEAIAIVFMILGAINFGVHFQVWRSLRIGDYAHNEEVRWFLVALGLVTLIITLVLIATGVAPDPLNAIRLAAFEVVSVMTSTGFGIADFSVWPLALPVLLIFISFVGGCGGSTAGGMKVIRFVVLGKQAAVHINRLIHPQLVRPVKIDGRAVPDNVIEAVWGFFAAYIFSFALIMLLLMMLGIDQISAFGAVATTLNNLGPGLGTVAVTFAGVPNDALYVLTFAMLLGRLEIFTFLVLMSPAFWRN